MKKKPNKRRIEFHEHDTDQPITHNLTTNCEYEILYNLWHHQDCLQILDDTKLEMVYGLTRIQHEQAVETLQGLANMLRH